MFLGLLTLLTALTISAVAIYYSVAGLVAIFAAAALPIMIMGGVLEISKLVTAVWLHRYWRQATWWLKTYLSTAVVVLMLITSMGIFGFLSKAHIEQTSASEETVARVETIQKEIDRQLGIVGRAENKIRQLETSGTSVDTNIQAQIDKEQERIDKAFERIQPAIDQQNKIIKEARADDANRTKPYEDQLTNIQAEILRLETSAKDYETKIENLDTDTSAVQPLLDQIASIEAEIIRVTNQVNSGERDQIRAGQAIIGVTSDGAFGSNTRKALVAWVAAQRERITQIQGDISKLRQNATATVDAERERLAGVVKDIRQTQIPALKDRELTMLGKIDEVRQTESPAIKTARDEIQRLRKSAEDQVAQSQALITRLQQQLANTDNTADIQKAIDEQNERARTASNTIDQLTEERIALESEYRKLEAEVGPIKYIAEFVYGEAADKNMLEEAVRWVIIIIIFVFDPLAVLLLIASQYTFEWRRSKDDNGGWLRQYEQARAQRIVDNPGYHPEPPAPAKEEEKVDDIQPTEDTHSESGTDGQDSRDTDDANLQDDNLADDESTINTVDEEPVPTGETVEEDAGPASNNTEEVEPKKKTDIELSEESNQDLENWNKWVEAAEQEVAKEQKKSIPDTRNRIFYTEELEDKQQYIMKEKGKQVTKETKPETSEGESQTGYIQNAEQNDDTLWKRMKDDRK